MDSMTVAILVIAVLSLVLSVVSLTWQAATFVLSGSRIQAELKHGARNAGVVATGPPGSQQLQALAAQGLTEEVLGVEVRNVGRLAASIDSVEAALEGGVKIKMLEFVTGPVLSHRLEPQSSASWSVPAAPVRAAVGVSAEVLKRANPCKVWMEVTVAGKIVRSKQSMLLGSRPELDR